MLKNVGTVRLIDKSLPASNLMSHCKPSLEIEVSWSRIGQQGLPGQAGVDGSDGSDGVSPTVTQLAAGDATCPAGGASVTDASGSTAHVCSGEDGAAGQTFSGTVASPNGEYSISITDAGITIAHGASNSIKLTGNDLEIRSEDIAVRSDFSTDVRAGTTAKIDAVSNLSLLSGGTALLRANGTLDLQGSKINMN